MSCKTQKNPLGYLAGDTGLKGKIQFLRATGRSSFFSMPDAHKSSNSCCDFFGKVVRAWFAQAF